MVQLHDNLRKMIKKYNMWNGNISSIWNCYKDGTYKPISAGSKNVYLNTFTTI